MMGNDGHFNINLTEDDLKTDSFAERIYETICKYFTPKRGYPITPERITFEILEEIENMDSPNILRNIKTLKNLGFKIAVDDF